MRGRGPPRRHPRSYFSGRLASDVDSPVSDGPRRILRPVILAIAAALVLQYLVGLWTNVYGPAGFTPGTTFPPYEAHFDLGVALGLLAIVLLLATVATRRASYAVLATVAFGSIVAAALFGQAFVGSSPNDPTDSVGMGVAFLLAFSSVLVMAFLEFSNARRPRAGPSSHARP